MIKKQQDIENTSLTIGNLVKIIVAVVLIAGYTILVYANTSSKLGMIETTQQIKHEQIDKNIEAILLTLEECKKINNNLSRSMDRILVILEQDKIHVDKKFEK